MASAKLSIDIEARLANLQTGLDKASFLVAKQAAEMEKRWAAVNKVFIGLGSTIGTAFAGVSIVGFVNRTIDAIDALNDVSDATGSSVENISALEDVAQRTGTTLDTVSSVLVKFNSGLKEADGENGVSQALKAIGLDAEQLKRVDPAEALRLTAVALAGYADDGNKARIIQELFGKSVREAAPFLKDLAEQGQLNATVTRQQAEEAEKFNKQIFGLQKNVTDLARDLTSKLVPALNDAFAAAKDGGFLAALDRFVGFDKQTFELNVLKRESEEAAYEVERVTELMLKLGAAIERNPGNDRAVRRFEALRQELAQLQQQANAANDALKRATDGYDPRTANPTFDDALSRRLARGEDGRETVGQITTGGTGKKEKAGIGGPAVDRIEAFRQSELLAQSEVNAALQASQLNTALDAARKRLEGTDAAKVKALRQELEALLSMQAAGGDTPALAEALGKVSKELEAADGVQASVIARQEELNALLANTPSAQLQRAGEQMAFLRQELNFAVDPVKAQQLKEALEALGESAKSLEQGVDKSLAEADTFGKRAAENIQDQLGDTLFQVFKGDFDNIGSAFGDLVLRMAAEAQAAQLGKALFGGAVGGEGSGLLGDLLGTVAGSFFGPEVINGGTINTNFIGSPSADGPTTTGDFARMDRAFARLDTGTNRVPQDMLALIHKDEAVVPAKYNPALGGGQGGNVYVTIEKTNDGRGDRVQQSRGPGGDTFIKAIVDQAVNQAVGEVDSRILSGGSTARALAGTFGLQRQPTARR